MKIFSLLSFLFIIFATAGVRVDQEFDVTVSGTSVKIIDADSSREYLLIQNKGSAAVLSKCDSAHSANEGTSISGPGNYEPFVAPTCAIYVKSTSGSQVLHVISGKRY